MEPKKFLTARQAISSILQAPTQSWSRVARTLNSQGGLRISCNRVKELHIGRVVPSHKVAEAFQQAYNITLTDVKVRKGYRWKPLANRWVVAFHYKQVRYYGGLHKTEQAAAKAAISEYYRLFSGRSLSKSNPNNDLHK